MENKLSRKIKKAFAYALAGTMAATVVGVGPFSAAGRVEATGGDIVINEYNFPDKVFRYGYLLLAARFINRFETIEPIMVIKTYK